MVKGAQLGSDSQDRARPGHAVSKARTFNDAAADEDAGGNGSIHLGHNGTKEMDLSTEYRVTRVKTRQGQKGAEASVDGHGSEVLMGIVYLFQQDLPGNSPFFLTFKSLILDLESVFVSRYWREKTQTQSGDPDCYTFWTLLQLGF